MSQRSFKSERSFEIVVKKNEPAKNKEEFEPIKHKI